MLRPYAAIASGLLALALIAPATVDAQEIEMASPDLERQIESAMSAAPSTVSAEARIMDWEMNELRPGSNGWTCLPDRPDTDETDPWCVNEPWLGFLHAYMNKTEPTYDEVGIAYMMAGDSPVSNSDPYASEPTGPEDWVTDLGAHLMILVPDQSALANISHDHRNGGPWIMWPGTPYAHIMIPVVDR